MTQNEHPKILNIKKTRETLFQEIQNGTLSHMWAILYEFYKALSQIGAYYVNYVLYYTRIILYSYFH